MAHTNAITVQPQGLREMPSDNELAAWTTLLQEAGCPVARVTAVYNTVSMSRGVDIVIILQAGVTLHPRAEEKLFELWMLWVNMRQYLQP
jgi:hypothetical protein